MIKRKLQLLLYMLRIRRVEFRIAEIPILAIPVLLLMRDATQLKTFTFWEGVFIFFLLFAFGDMINCLADRDLDAVYKPHLSQAVYGLGVPFVKFQIGVSAIVALALSLHLSWLTNNWLIFPLVAAGLILGAVYSVKPVQLKSRGLAQLVCLWLIIFVGPMLFVGLLLSTKPSLLVIIFAAVYGMLQMGVILVNTAEDYPEDLAANIKTSIVSLGLRKGIAFSFWLTLTGAIGILVILSLLFIQKENVIWLIGTTPVLASCVYVTANIGKLKSGIVNSNLTDSIQSVKLSAKNIPLWVTLIAWSTLSATLMLYLAR